jgi:hypothetical protein
MLPDVGTHQVEDNGPRGNASAVQGLELFYPLVIGVRHKAAANVCVRVCALGDCVHVRVQVGSCVQHESPALKVENTMMACHMQILGRQAHRGAE